MPNRLLVAVALAALLLLGTGVATAMSPPSLAATGPTSVTGTTATGVFRLGDRTIREVRYADGGTLVYTFRLSNGGRLPVQVAGVVPPATQPRLFRVLRLRDGSGASRFSIGPGQSRTVSLALRMTGCETLSARAGSLVAQVTVLAAYAPGWREHQVTVTLPEQVRTGSPREAACADSTATSRPPG